MTSTHSLCFYAGDSGSDSDSDTSVESQGFEEELFIAEEGDVIPRHDVMASGKNDVTEPQHSSDQSATEIVLEADVARGATENDVQGLDDVIMKRDVKDAGQNEDKSGNIQSTQSTRVSEEKQSQQSVQENVEPRDVLVESTTPTTPTASHPTPTPITNDSPFVPHPAARSVASEPSTQLPDPTSTQPTETSTTAAPLSPSSPHPAVTPAPEPDILMQESTDHKLAESFEEFMKSKRKNLEELVQNSLHESDADNPIYLSTSSLESLSALSASEPRLPDVIQSTTPDSGSRASPVPAGPSVEHGTTGSTGQTQIEQIPRGPHPPADPLVTPRPHPPADPLVTPRPHPLQTPWSPLGPTLLQTPWTPPGPTLLQTP